MCEFIPEDKGINASFIKIGGRWLIVSHYQETMINSYLLKNHANFLFPTSYISDQTVNDLLSQVDT